ncbi:MAG: hypothetical protein AAF628_09995 [Planctomycetota bacterium]
MASRTAASRNRPWWAGLDYEDLLDVRLCDLGLVVEGTALQGRIQRLYRELAKAGQRFRPHVWLSTSWFCPDGVPGFGVPFFLAHPRLARIEHRHMLEVEGGSYDWCMKLLRHETGHAIDNAYRLHWRKRWREAFGAFSKPYSRTYQPRPRSRNYVVNLDYWYAQSHPAEDWAECFAVWLQPGSQWRKRYAGWPAKRKLETVDELMAETGPAPARVTSRQRVDSLPRLQLTLREYYARKQDAYAPDGRGELDAQLLRVFSTDPGYRGRATAASFLVKHRQGLRNQVAAATGQYRYVVDQALKEMIAGCKRQRLRLTKSDRPTEVAASALLTSITMSFLHGRKREFWR